MSVVCKVMESILKDNILGYLQQHHWFHGSQHGFLPGRSTQTAHLAYLPCWYTEMLVLMLTFVIWILGRQYYIIILKIFVR